MPTSTPYAPPATAVFIDGDWLLVACRQADIALKPGQLVAALRGAFGLDLALRAYCSVPKARNGALQAFADAFGAEMPVRTIVMRQPGKSHIDDELVADVAALGPSVRTVVLISGDAGFAPLLERLRADGRRVVLVSFPLQARALGDAASEFMNLEGLLAAAAATDSPAAAATDSRTPAAMGHQPAAGSDTRAAADAGSAPALPRQFLIDKGQHLASYLVVRKILIGARRQVSLFDPYLGAEAFDLLGCLEPSTEVVIVTDARHVPRDLAALVARCRKEGRRLRVFSSTDVHDRYLRVDDAWWHSGHSFKDLGGRVSQLSRVEPETAARMGDIERRTIAAATELLPPPV